MVSLRVREGPGKGMIFRMEKESATLGRDAGCDFQVPDQGVSRRHAEVYRIGEMYFVRDLGSRNGTYVNEERINEEMLRNGDRIRLGGTVLVFEDRAPEGDSHEVVYSKSADPGATIEYKVSALALSDVEEPKERRPAGAVESRYLSFLYQMAREAAVEKDERMLMERAAQLSAEAVGADECYVLLCSTGDEREVTLEAAYQSAPGAKPMVSRSVIGPVLKRGRAVVMPCVQENEYARDKSSLILSRVSTVMCAPVVAADRVLGVLYITSKKPYKSFDEEDVELMVAAGVQLGTALAALRAEKRQRETALGVIRIFVEAAESRNPEQAGHSETVADVALAVSEVLRIPKEECDTLVLAALLHNIGRLTIPDEKIEETRMGLERERLLAEEAAAILSRIGGLERVVPIVRHSYEHYDGSGVPDGLSGEEIPMASRVIAAARQYALVRGRTGSAREAFSHVNRLIRSGWLDPRIGQALAVAYRRGLLGGAASGEAEGGPNGEPERS